MQTVTLSLFRFDKPGSRFWLAGQMALARMALMGMKQVGFWKICGSGMGEGFTPQPNFTVWAILATWPDEETARRDIENAPVYKDWTKHASETWTIFLNPINSRGKWSGKEPFQPDGVMPEGALAVLTRASLRPHMAARFWGRVPDISAVIGTDPNIVFKIGIGEIPVLHQATFSIWPDTETMAAFARGNGAHGKAIKAVYDEGWFSEDLYARFRIAGAVGSWNGVDPLAKLNQIPEPVAEPDQTTEMDAA
ncbi:spheroidene monooxygenase [Rhodobacter ferrooxidans]|uniref:Spheroidene monooxygenase n=1 Tax=Rhodobacter ferrooxidans TaxID=371731 RepID=C8RYP4_9RHOB|nr:hypothetical protein [Rhodobacter sp. SW2]EEW26232.1 spheroidene monooxygenase [Rhodobacter sp. SW2]